MSCTKIACNTTTYTVINNLFRIEQPWFRIVFRMKIKLISLRVITNSMQRIITKELAVMANVQLLHGLKPIPMNQIEKQ